MIEKNSQKSWTFWQSQSEGVPEPAILIEEYSDSVSLTCEGNRININYESLDELLKLLRKIKREQP